MLRRGDGHQKKIRKKKKKKITFVLRSAPFLRSDMVAMNDEDSIHLAGGSSDCIIAGDRASRI